MTLIVDVNDHATCASDGSATARSPLAASRSPIKGIIVIIDVNEHATCASDGSATSRSPLAASRSPVIA
jgi:hypothetical protein